MNCVTDACLLTLIRCSPSPVSSCQNWTTAILLLPSCLAMTWAVCSLPSMLPHISVSAQRHNHSLHSLQTSNGYGCLITSSASCVYWSTSAHTALHRATWKCHLPSHKHRITASSALCVIGRSHRTGVVTFNGGRPYVAVAALHAWNNLPNAIHCRPNAIHCSLSLATFKHSLKTYFYTQCFYQPCFYYFWDHDCDICKVTLKWLFSYNKTETLHCITLHYNGSSSDNDANSNSSNIAPQVNKQTCIKKAVQQTINSNFR